MKYLLMVSHAGLAEGVRGALSMLMGARDFVLACGMGESEKPEDFAARVDGCLGTLAGSDEVVLLADIAGGSPVRAAAEVLAEKGIAARVVSGLNLPMAISAVMGIEDELDLDAIRDAVLADGAQAVREG